MVKHLERVLRRRAANAKLSVVVASRNVQLAKRRKQESVIRTASSALDSSIDRLNQCGIVAIRRVTQAQLTILVATPRVRLATRVQADRVRRHWTREDPSDERLGMNERSDAMEAKKKISLEWNAIKVTRGSAASSHRPRGTSCHDQLTTLLVVVVLGCHVFVVVVVVFFFRGEINSR
jgi:hypothetical protein